MGYKLYVLGTRGSRMVNGREFEHFGGGTSCYVITDGSYALVIDAGTGLSNGCDLLKNCKKVDLVFTHIHYDHLIGLLDFEAFPRGLRPCLYGTFHEWGIDAPNTEFVRPPFWPVRMPRKELNSIVRYKRYPFGLHVCENFENNAAPEDCLYVTLIASNHPDYASAIQIEVNQKKILFLYDFEHGQPLPEQAKQPYDLLFYDGMYTAEEYLARKGYGHSTPEEAVATAKAIGAKQLIVVHHDPKRTDEMLFAMERATQAMFPNSTFAYKGQEFIL